MAVTPSCTLAIGYLASPLTASALVVCSMAFRSLLSLPNSPDRSLSASRPFYMSHVTRDQTIKLFSIDPYVY
jgi:hypothetical protein